MSSQAQPPVNRRALLGFMAMVLGNFMAVLDIQIVASSINELQAGLSASADEIQWVQTAYLIAEVIGIPLSGLLSRALSTRGYYILCALGFTLASLGCAMSWSLGSMVVFRVLQGFLGAGMIPTTFSAIYSMFPPGRRVLPQVMAGMTTTLAPSLGPTVGGYITGIASWHWLFLLNVVPGIIVVFAVWRLVHIDRPDLKLLREFDAWSLLGMAAFLGGLEYTLDEGPRHDWFAQSGVVLSALLATFGGVLFFWRAVAAAHPVVQLRAFSNRNFAIGSLLAFVLGLNLYTLVYITPTYLGQVRGYDAMQIGEVMGVQGLAMFFCAPLAGGLLGRIGARPMIFIGLVAVGIGTWINASLTADWGFREFIVPQLLRGFGFVLCFIAMTDIAMGTLPPDEVKNASGLFNVMRNIGGAIGLALIVTAINHQNWQHWQTLAESTRITREPMREQLLATGQLLQSQLGTQSQAGALGLIARQMQQQAAAMTYGDMYRLLSLAVFGSLPLLLLARKPRHVELDGGAH